MEGWPAVPMFNPGDIHCTVCRYTPCIKSAACCMLHAACDVLAAPVYRCCCHLLLLSRAAWPSKVLWPHNWMCEHY